MEQQQSIAQWCANNPYLLYADRSDQLSDALTAQLLAATSSEQFNEWMNAWHEDVCEFDILRRDSPHFHDLLVDTGHKGLLQENSFVAAHQLDQLFELYVENYELDSSPMLQELVRRHVNVAAELLDEHGNPLRVLFDDEDVDSDGFAAIKAVLPGISRSDLNGGGFYHGCTLKALGIMSLFELYQQRRAPEKIQLPSRTLIVAHCDTSGAGFEVGEFTLTQPVRCRLIHDEAERYGVQATFGFSGYVWRNSELKPVWE